MRLPRILTKLWRLGLIALLIAILLLPTYFVRAAPTDAYWVGNTGAVTDATNHWALTSGGLPNALNMPDSTTYVHFDVNSFTLDGQTVTIDAFPFNIKSADFIGVLHTPTFDYGGSNYLVLNGGSYNCTSNITNINSSTVIFGDGPAAPENLTFYSTSFVDTITEGGGFATFTGNLTLLGTVSCNYILAYMGNTTFADGSTINAAVNIDTNIAVGLNFGHCVVNTPLLQLQTTQPVSFGLAILNISTLVEIAGPPAVLNFESATINTPQISFIASGVAYNLDKFPLSGSPGNYIDVNGEGSPFILSIPSGIINTDYLRIQDSNATGGATWLTGPHSVDLGGNSGWIFTTLPPATPLPVEATYIPVVFGIIVIIAIIVLIVLQVPPIIIGIAALMIGVLGILGSAILASLL